MNDALPWILMTAAALVALRYLVILRVILYPIAVIAIVLGLQGTVVAHDRTSLEFLVIGLILFGGTYVMGRLQWRAADRSDERFASGGTCPECHGSGRISDPFTRVMKTCPRCGGIGHG